MDMVERSLKIKETLEQKLQAEVHVSNLMDKNNHHLDLTIVSDIFAGKSILEQHQLVMDELKKDFSQGLHAVKIKTLTPDKFNAQKGS